LRRSVKSEKSGTVTYIILRSGADRLAKWIYTT
jgi:hypothetical protein